jgi:hypothetical protein
MLLTTQSEVLTAAERLGDELVEAKSEVSEEEYTTVLLQCNQELKEELGIDYGAVCSSSDCC